MLVDQIMSGLERKAADRQPTRRIGAHNVGSCVRKLWYTVHGYPTEALSGRTIALFDLGDRVEDAVMEFIERSGVAHVRGRRDQDKVAVPEIGGGNVVADFFFEHEGEQLVGEIKSMSDFAYARAERGEIDEQYLCQVEVYMRAYNTRRAVIIAYRKETSHICEVVVERDDDRWARIKMNATLACSDDLPPRPYQPAVDCEECGGTGKTPAKGLAHKACDGTGKLPYGPIIPRFPCGYCGFREPCWGELKQTFDVKGRPVWRVVEAAA